MEPHRLRGHDPRVPRHTALGDFDGNIRRIFRARDRSRRRSRSRRRHRARHTSISRTISKVGILKPRIRHPRRRRQLRRPKPLPVRRLALLHAHIHISRPSKLILVQGMVLERGAQQPRAGLRLDERPPPGSDGLPQRAVEVVVRRPAPHVLDVRAGGGGQVQEQEGGLASEPVGGGGAGVAHAGAARAADPEVRVPEGHGPRVGAAHGDLEEDGAREDVGDGEEEVGDLRRADGARGAELEERLWVAGVGKEGVGGGDGGEGFAD